MSNLQLVLVTQAAKNITPQQVDMRVPLYSAGCERKIRNALSHIKGLYSIDADLANQKVTVIGIVDREEVLAAIRTKRKDAHFLNEELCRIDKVSDPSPQYAKTRTSNGTLPIDVSNLRAATTSAVKSIKRSIVKRISFRGRSLIRE